MSSASATVVGSVVRFPTPPLGLVATQYLLTPVASARGVHTLRATDEEDLRLFLIDPAHYFPSYLPTVNRILTHTAGADLKDVAVFVVLNPGEGGEHPTANLLAPILIDIAEGIGVQTVLDGDDWPLRAPLAPAAEPA